MHANNLELLPFEIAPRRPGDPAQIVAASDRVRMKFRRKPQHDNLATIIAHASRGSRGCEKQVLMPQ